MSNEPKVPNLKPQPSAPGKKKNVIWMACRGSPGCEGKYAEVTLTRRNSFMDGGGTWNRYQCQTCKKAWSITL